MSERNAAMNASLLLIDPQNDFCDIEGAALPVGGANADMQRLADLIARVPQRLVEIIVTLDTHATVSIERTTFWSRADGASVAPFTEITEQAVRSGRFVPRESSRLPEVLAYLHALEAGRRYRLMVWPVHCVLGTWGHNIHAALAAQIAVWEERNQRSALKVLKGMNPMTEQYSAVRAEVPRHDDPLTQTNSLLVSRAKPGDGVLLVAGEASSHCVAATLTDLMETMTPRERGRVIILRDCMSPVSGFESAAEAFFVRAAGQGVRVMTAAEVFA
jgi:nicotinamidase-related amidase